MKKLSFIVSLLLAANILSAQNTFPATGNVGIGTAAPAYNLDISSATNTTLRIGSTTVNTGYSNLIFKGSLNSWTVSKSPSGSGPTSSGTLNFTYNNGVYNGELPVMTFFNSSSNALSVIIGSNNTSLVGSCALCVAGEIGARELVISSATPFPDYVFAPGYKLHSLTEIEKYIKQYSHLPEMPSAQDVKKDGLVIGKMTTALVQKVEELTLYVIEMNKKIEKLEKENNELKAKK